MVYITERHKKTASDETKIYKKKEKTEQQK